GYVGLPLAVAFAQIGFHVVGIDIDQRKVDSLNRGDSYIEDVPSEELAPLVASGHLRASAEYSALADVDTISICVPTPLRKTKDPDISYIINATDSIVKYGGAGKLIVLESTTYPGTTEEVILPRLANDNATVGEDFFLAFSPERIDPGRTDYTMFTTPKVIGGTTPACLEVAMQLYGTVVQNPVPVASTKSAEMVKLLENTFRSVNIGMVNEVAIMCGKLGIDVWEVIEAAATKPYGFMKFTPGPGLGGHCIPIDPHYLSWKLKTLNYTARFIELADEVNRFMPEYVVEKVTTALNDQAKAVRGSRVLILGVAYKPNISDVRESPALDIIQLLLDRGAEIVYHDPHVPTLEREGYPLDTQALDSALLNSADCTVIVSNHKAIAWDLVATQASVIVDTRNVIKSADAQKLYKLS
ncbi:MAG: nucleotide sugar dehydrogenase, partial [Candidatus Promineifilaceae bacterium]